MSDQSIYMYEYLQRIASLDPHERRRELLAILGEIGCASCVYEEQIAGHLAKNIVVRFHDQEPRFVLGAHYDSVAGSTGANDNGAAVCILLALLQKYSTHPPARALDVVFFDLEEYYLLGSQAYIRHVSPENVSAMLNLDICGVGDTLCLGPEKYVQTGIFKEPVRRAAIDTLLPYCIFPVLPSGDNDSFEKAGIPNLSLCILPASDLDIFKEAMLALSQGKQPQRRPAILDTFHHGSRDKIETIELAAMERVLYWVTQVLSSWDTI